MAAPTFAAQTSGGYDGGDGTTLTVALPAGSSSYLALVGVLRGAPFFNPPTCTGWALIKENYTTGSTDTRLMLYKANTASSPGTVWTFPSAGRQQSVVITGYTDTDYTVDVSSAVSTSSAVAATVTASAAGLAVRAIADNTYNEPTPVYTYPAGTSHGRQQFSVAGTGDGCGVAYADASVSAGATGTATFGITAPASLYEPAAVTLVLLGAGGGSSNGGLTVGAARGAGAAGAVALSGVQPNATLTVGAARGAGAAAPVALSVVRNVTLTVGASSGSGKAGAVALSVVQPNATLTVGAAQGAGAAGPVVLGATQNATLTVGAAGGSSRAGAVALSGVRNVTLTVGAARGQGRAPHTTISGNASVTRFWTGVSANNRYFVDQFGDPFLIHGDSPWSLMLDLDTAGVELYLSTRQAQGFNTILFSAIGTTGTGGPSDDGDTYDGVNPFTTDWDIDSPNETYWARLDSYLDLCEDYGFSVQLYALDTFGAHGYVYNLTDQAQRLAYGAFLGARYGSRPNVVWAVGGDFDNNSTTWADHNPNLKDVVTGIRSVVPGALVTIQLTGFPQSNSFDNSFWDNSSGAPLIQWSFAYTYNPTYDTVLQGYAHTWGQAPTTRPVLFGEGNYFQENNKAGTATTTDETLRRQMLWAITSGSPGEFYGAGGVWYFDTGAFLEWWTRITPTPPHVTQLQKLHDFIASKAWQKLVPDTGSAFVTAGRGTFVTGGGNGFTGGTDTDPLANNYVTAAVAADKSLGVVYVPAGGTTITVDKTKVNGSTYYWVDPTDATATTTATFSGNNVTSPGNHAADGDGQVASDWLLVMEGTPVSPDGGLTVGAAGGSGRVGAVTLSGVANGALTVGAARGSGAAGPVVLFAGQSATLTVGAAAGSGAAGPVTLSGVQNVTVTVGAAEGSGQAGAAVLGVVQPNATMTVGAAGGSGQAGSVTIGATQNATFTVGAARGAGAAGVVTLSGISNGTLTVGAAQASGQAGAVRLLVPNATMLVGAARGSGAAGAARLVTVVLPEHARQTAGRIRGLRFTGRIRG